MQALIWPQERWAFSTWVGALRKHNGQTVTAKHSNPINRATSNAAAKRPGYKQKQCCKSTRHGQNRKTSSPARNTKLKIVPRSSWRMEPIFFPSSLRPLSGTIDCIPLVCPTFIHNKTYDGFAKKNDQVFAIVPAQKQDALDKHLRWLSLLFKGTNTRIVLNDCAASKDVKSRSYQLVNWEFSARHIGISGWVFTQQFTSIAKSYRENIAGTVLFYTPSAQDMKAMFESYAGEFSLADKQELQLELSVPEANM